MSLGSFLYSTYKQYKEDTAYVATWLAETAKACGYDSPIFHEPIAPKVKRAKGKNYKKAVRDAARRVAARQRHHIIPIKDFIPFAENIAKYDSPPVQVPDALLKRAKRAIKARHRCRAFYNAFESSQGEDNGGHLHFINVLKGVLAVLNPQLSSDPTVEDILVPELAKSSLASEGTQSFTNFFAALEREGKSEEYLEASSVTTEHDDAIKVSYEPEPMEAKEKFDFAAYCLFADINQILGYVRSLWQTYAYDQIDLVAASVTANTAIDMVRRLEEEFMRDFPKTKDTEEIIMWAFAMGCVQKGDHPGRRLRPDDEINFDCYDQAEYHMVTTFMMLRGFTDSIEPKSVPLYKAGHYGIYEPRVDRSTKQARDKFLEDKIVLLEALPDFCYLAQIQQHVPAEDELTRGLKEMMRSKEISLWLVFAAQAFLEAHHVLRENVDKGFADLRRRGTQIKKTVQSNLNFHQQLRIDHWPESNDRVIAAATIDLVNAWLLADPIRDDMLRRLKGVPPTIFPPPFHLLKQHPLLCGLFKFALDLQMQNAAITFVNAWGSAMYTAHLYHAVVQEGACTADWPEMDMVIRIHTPERIFVGGKPTSPDQYIKRFCLCIGYSAAHISNYRGSHSTVASKIGPRGLKEASPVSQLFRRRYVGNAGKLDINLEEVEALLNDRFESSTDPEERIEEDGGTLSMVSVRQRESQKASRKLSRKFKQAKKLTMLELLLALQASITLECPELEFDYLAFHRKCWRLLREVQSRLHSSLLNYVDPGYLEHEYQLPFVVGYIFATASQSDRMVRQVLKLRDNTEVTSKSIRDAGKVIEDFLLKDQGNEAEDTDDGDEGGTLISPANGAPSEVPLPNLPGINSMQDLLDAARMNGIGDYELTDVGRAAEAARLR